MTIKGNKLPEKHSPFLLDALKIPTSLSYAGENKASNSY